MARTRKFWGPPQPSPWTFVNSPSPDGEKTIEYTDVGEIRMGAPLSGRCYLTFLQTKTRHLISDDAGGPAVWSADNRFVALPVWLPSLSQKLGVFEISTLALKLSSQSYGLLHIKKFENNKIEGILPGKADEPFSMDLDLFFPTH